MAEQLSEELKDLVRNSLELLGKAIELEYGKKIFNEVESIRVRYKESRGAELENALEVNNETLNCLLKLKKQERYQVAHSFAVSLEIINACENAYRTYRLRQKKFEAPKDFEERITYVLTAHPTESRSPECIAIMTEISSLLVQTLEEKTDTNSELLHLLIIALKTPVSRSSKPEVKDEADYIYSTTLRKEILLPLLENLEDKRTVYLRTWVGGDKDGHPGVNARVMIQSLQASRDYLLNFINDLLADLNKHIARMPQDNASKKITLDVTNFKKHLKAIEKIKTGDGKKIAHVTHSLNELIKSYKTHMHVEAPALKALKTLLDLFPCLVIPLELRESSTLIRDALKNKKAPIAEMMIKIKEISKGAEAIHYARALVVSSTENAQDILDAFKVLTRIYASKPLPLVPLFESRNSLENAQKILDEAFSNKSLSDTCKKEWSSHFEVMLGYSDSAKENGSLLSRTLIREALFGIEKQLKAKGITPIFFHGSGGSVARGGGSLEEQVSWWPLSSRKIFKVTLQGEMVYRSFSTSEIFKSQVSKILTNSRLAKASSHSEFREEMLNFSAKVSKKYRELVFNSEFLSVVEKTTPYTYLNELKIGSRPSKRVKCLGIDSLRAIPWVLCWTQIRSLLPIWWGIGSTWKELSFTEKEKIKKAYQSDTFFSSFVKLLAFSVAKVNLAVWFSYLINSSLEKNIVEKYQTFFKEELDSTYSFLREVSGEEDILWFRPWLEKSIKLRSTMIHPLNMSQILALKEKDAQLLRETVTGIASGMLTTG